MGCFASVNRGHVWPQVQVGVRGISKNHRGACPVCRAEFRISEYHEFPGPFICSPATHCLPALAHDGSRTSAKLKVSSLHDHPGQHLLALDKMLHRELVYEHFHVCFDPRLQDVRTCSSDSLHTTVCAPICTPIICRPSARLSSIAEISKIQTLSADTFLMSAEVGDMLSSVDLSVGTQLSTNPFTNAVTNNIPACRMLERAP